jgi:hypothetical protein
MDSRPKKREKERQECKTGALFVWGWKCVCGWMKGEGEVQANAIASTSYAHMKIE